MREIDEINTLTKLPEWIEVENRHKKKIGELMDIRTIDEKLSGDEMKIEIRARQLAVQKMIDFLDENGFSRVKKEDIDVTFE